MNGLKASAAELGKIMQGAADLSAKVDLMICPPATLIMTFAAVARGSRIAIGGQDCHAEPSGAFTGDISAEMLADPAPSAVIVGHSERRTLHKETDAEVRAKAQAAWRAGLTAIVCVGETRAEREAGQTLDVLGPPARRLAAGRRDRRQSGGRLRAGLGDRHRADADAGRRRARPTDSSASGWSSAIGAAGQAIRILYGGSVKPSNAKELLAVANVDGALVGGASLKAEDFLGIAARLPVEPARKSVAACAGVEMRGGDRVETAANSYMSGSRTGPVGLWPRLSGSFMQTVVILIHLMIVLAMIGPRAAAEVRRRRARHGRRRRRRLHDEPRHRQRADPRHRRSWRRCSSPPACSCRSWRASTASRARSCRAAARPAAPGRAGGPGEPGGGVLNQLGGGTPQPAPAAPAAPSGPQVPRQ